MKRPDEKSWLTVSDWITFLSAEKHGMAGTMLNFVAILVAMVALILSLKADYWWQAFENGIVAIVFVVLMQKFVIGRFERRQRLAQKILNRIMSGELQSEERIRTEWEQGLLAGRKKRRD